MLTFKQIVVTILGIIGLFIGSICVYSILQMSFAPQGSIEMKFWDLISSTTLIIFFLLMPITFILCDKVFPTKSKEESNAKEKWETIDYLTAFFLIGGLILEGISIIGFGYLTIFIPFNELKRVIIFNVPFPSMVQILIYIGLGMQSIAIILIVLFIFEKDDELKLKRKEKTIREKN